MKTAIDYLRRAKAKLEQSWQLLLLSAFAAFEVLAAVLEFVLHVLRIPHWH